MDFIKPWTREQRYLPYNHWKQEEIKQLEDTVKQSKWRLNYHIQPKSGLLNDPNGFSYFNNKWHIFHQIYPFGPVHGLKSWRHLQSDNLIDWEDLGLALTPNHHETSHGVYSGSAFVHNDKLLLFLTGNHFDQANIRHPYQLIMTMNQQNQFADTYQTILDDSPAQYTEHFRDPQIIKFNDQYLMVIGAQDQNLHGQIALYTSKNLKTFTYLGQLNLNLDLGYMVECPNLIQIDDKLVLIFCPQGLNTKEHHYQNIYPNTYIIGDDLDFNNLSLTNQSKLQNLDEGFDLYATQVFNAPDGRTLAISWLGLPDTTYPSDMDQWSGCLSLVKELTIKNNHLYQYPVSETKDLRIKHEQLTYHANNTYQEIKTTKNSYELELTIDNEQIIEFLLYSNSTKNKYLKLTIDQHKHRLTLNRSHFDLKFATNHGEIRATNLPTGPITLNIFIDTSAIEIYINKGYKTLTARIFPDEEQTHTFIKLNQEKTTINMYPLRQINLNNEV